MSDAPPQDLPGLQDFIRALAAVGVRSFKHPSGFAVEFAHGKSNQAPPPPKPRGELE